MDHKRQMFQATCSECGNKCEVPFRPSGGKPVLCSDCFGNKGNRNQGRSSDRSRSGDRGDRRMYQAVCDNCGQKCEVPFKPTSGKPIYCKECFSKNTGHKERRGNGSSDQVSQQLKKFNDKLDRVLTLLDPGVVLEKSQVEKEAGKFVPKKPAAKKTAPKVKTKSVKKKATKKKK